MTKRTLKPLMRAWMILAAIWSSIAALGVIDLVFDPQKWPYALVLIAASIVVIGYNFTARLVIDGECITFKRYGRVVWRTSRRGAQFDEGLAGDVPIIPAIIVRQNGHTVGFVAKAWFDEAALKALRAASLD